MSNQFALAGALVALCAGPGTTQAEPPLARFRVADEPRVSERVIPQGEWAAELVFALGLAAVLPDRHNAADLFALLCAEQAERVTEAGGHRVPSGAPFHVAVEAPRPRHPNEPVRVVVTIPATALYALTISGVGPQRWAIDQRPIGHLDPSPLGVAQAPRVVPLRAGPHELTAYLTHAARVDRVELSAYRPLCIAPAEGWRAQQPLTFASNARTLVRALGLERQLPIDGAPISLEGESYQSASAWGGRTNRDVGPDASAGEWATAVDSPAEFVYRTQVDEPAVFTLLARVHGSGSQIWSVDGRYRVTVRPGEAAKSFGWAHVMTLPLESGDHVIRALLPRGAGIDSLHFIRRRATDSDYIAVLEDAGFKSGVPHQPVTQTDAYVNLSNPLFAEISSHFLARLAGDAPKPPYWVLDAEIDSIAQADAKSGS